MMIKKWIPYGLSIWMAIGLAMPCMAQIKLFVVAGQSNADGQGLVADLVSPYDQPQTNVLVWFNDVGTNWVDLAPGMSQSGSHKHGMELSLGKKLYDTWGGDIRLIKYARNATSITQWMPDTYFYKELEKVVLAATNSLAGQEYVFEGFFWMQGEGDSVDTSKANAYGSNLTTMVSALRDRFSAPDMRVILGRIGAALPLETYPYADIVRTAQVTVAASDAIMDWVDTDTLPLQADSVHYTSAGLIDLGISMADSYRGLKEIPVSTHDVAVAEGGTNTFQVRLDLKPATTVTVLVSRVSGDTNIQVQSESELVFTTNNWNTWKTVTLFASLDADSENGEAIVQCLYAGRQTMVSVTEQDAAYLLPWTETFENDGIHAGTPGLLDGQHGWVSDAGAVVTNSDSQSGSQALLFSDATISHPFFGNPSNVWMTFWANPQSGNVPGFISPDATAVFYKGANNLLVAFDSTHAAEISGATLSNGWNKFELQCDYVSKVWNLTLNGIDVVTNFAFYSTNRNAFAKLQVMDNTTSNIWLDTLSITDVAPMPPPALSEILSYRFNTNFLDSSVSGNHGTASGNAAITTSSNNVVAGSGALSLDGTTNSYVDLNTSVLFTGSDSWTSLFWAKRGETGAQHGMVMGDRGNTTDFIWLNDDYNGLRFRSSANNNFDFAASKDMDMHHYALVASGSGSMTLYRDGVFSQTLTGNTGFNITSVGRAYSNPGYDFAFQGILDEVHVYTHALTSNQVYAIYTNEYTAPDSPAPSNTPSRIRVFLQGGQSNADGRADPTGQPSYSDVDFYYNVQGGSGTLTTLFPGASEIDKFGPELTFGRRTTDLLQSSTTRVAVIKYANGGTNLRYQWKAGGDATTTGDGTEYVTFQTTVADGLAALAGQYTAAVITVEGMIWMQGESDAMSGYANTYFANLTNFIADIRATYGANLPFIVGRLSDAQTYINSTALQALQTAQNNVASADPRVGLVSTDDLTPLLTVAEDGFGDLHFGPDGQLEMGKRFALETAYLLWVTDQLSPAQIDAGDGGKTADPDGDGIINSDEFISGTDVINSNSLFRFDMNASGTDTYEVSHSSAEGRLYKVETCSNLTDAVWSNVTAEIDGTSGVIIHSVTNMDNQAFYRVRATLP